MHESGITEDMLSHALEEASRAGLRRLHRINLVRGEASEVEEDSIRFYFETLSRGTPAEGAELFFRTVPLLRHCQSCGATFGPGENLYRCPRCQQGNSVVLSGRDFYIESIEGE